MTERNRDGLRVERVAPEHETAALELLLATVEGTARNRRISLWREQAKGGPVEGLWAAWQDQRMVGVMRVETLGGRTALVSPPRLATDEPHDTACELLRRVVDALPQAGVQLAQAILESDHGPDAKLLALGGFRQASDLLYLVSTSAAFPQNAPAENLEFLCYGDAGHARMARVVERTYLDSRDFQAVDGLRTIDDVLQGYQRSGAFDPAHWYVVQYHGVDVGCLLLMPEDNEDNRDKVWELTYMGVVPEARRRGLGVNIVRHAQWLAGQTGVDRVVLAVDAGNEPAIAAYAACGFVAWDRRSVFLRVF